MNRKTTDYIVVHCSASQPLSSITAKTIDGWHRERGFKKIGYHFVILTDGSVEIGRDIKEIGAHVAGYNSKSIGICMIGGVDKHGKSVNNFKPAQFASLRKLTKTLLADYPKAVIMGHRDFPNVKKDCPCFDVSDWWALGR